MATQIELPPNVQAITNPLLLGYLFNWALYGVLGVQVYMYYMSFPSDPRYSKYLVLGLFLIETAQTAIVTHDVFARFGPGYGNVAALGSVHLVWLSVPVFSGIVSCIVQLFFAHRIMVLSKTKWSGVFIAAVALMQGSAGIAQGVQAFMIGELALLAKNAFPSCVVWLAGSAACDVMIAMSMTYYLATRDTYFNKTRDILNRVIRLTIETGSLTAAVATVDIILFLAFPNNDYHITPALTLAKLYTNTLLVILNSRIKVVGGRQESSINSHTRSREETSNQYSQQLRIKPKGDNHSIAVNGMSMKSPQVWNDDIPLGDLESGKFRTNRNGEPQPLNMIPLQ